METTKDLESLYMAGKLLELRVHNLLSVAPKYLKLITSSSFSPLMVMSAMVLGVLFTMIFGFSFHMLLLYNSVCWRDLAVQFWCHPQGQCHQHISGWRWVFHRLRYRCGGHREPSSL
ncbi:hypothetical protein DPMN_050250 [Dreissena polymorpha]|uniref:Uncharacterized protein n=1 Tax=Dreissena polymorpha TaxID=45954 RepID=A0A9D4HM36_DREPO|nr:hypothetical protein DPMN_050250 [Dreissena polymorpha]